LVQPWVDFKESWSILFAGLRVATAETNTVEKITDLGGISVQAPRLSADAYRETNPFSLCTLYLDVRLLHSSIALVELVTSVQVFATFTPKTVTGVEVGVRLYVVEALHLYV
jgi:hypothetical protein